MAGYKIGSVVICSITVKNSAGTLVNPATSMTIQVERLSPYAIIVSSTGMTNDSTGTYHYDLVTAGYSLGNYKITYTATDGTRISIEDEALFLE